MKTRRTIVWLLLFVLLVPAAVATADALQRANERGLIVRSGELHEGERFAYDLTFHSTINDLSTTVRDQIVVEVGHVTSLVLIEGSTAEVLPVTVTTKNPPWLALRGERDEHRETVYIRLSDGLVVQAVEHYDVVRYDLVGDTFHRSEWVGTRQHYATDRWGAAASTVYRGPVTPGAQYVNNNEPLEIALSIMGIHVETTHGHGVWNGKSVYLATHNDWSDHGPLHAFGCAVDQPKLVYQDPESAAAFSGAEVERSVRHETWMLPGLAVPALSQCQAAYRHEGRLVEEVSLVLSLGAHTPGGRIVTVDHRTGDIPLAIPIPAEPVMLPGIPRQGDVDLRFPLQEAVDILRTYPDLRDFRDEGPVPFHVTALVYQPVAKRHPQAIEPPDSLAPLDDSLLQEGRTEERDVDVNWQFVLQNAAFETRRVDLVRTYGTQGSVLDERVGVQDGPPPATMNDEAFSSKDHSAELVPLAAMLDRWAVEEGVSVEDWMAADRSRVELRAGFQGSGEERWIRPIYRVSQSEERGDEGWSETSAAYEGEDGLLFKRDQRYSRSGSHESRPQGSVPASLPVDPVTVQPHVPVAATVSGVVVAAALVAAFFSDAVARGFGQIGVAPLYAKVRKEKVLDHATRDRIVAYVGANPGAPVGAVRRHLEVGYGTVMHHLNTLERNRLLVSRRVGRERCYFPAGVVPPGEMEAVAASKTTAARRFLDLVAVEPGLNQKEVADRLAVAPTAVRYQARRLLAHGRLRAVQDGRSVRYYPIDTDPARQPVGDHRSSHPIHL